MDRKLEHNVYINNLLKSYIRGENEQDTQMMLVRHYNSFQVSLEEVEASVSQEYRKGLLYHKYEKNDIKEPYEPFINGIRYWYRKYFSEYTVEEFVDLCNVYSLHKDMFVSYLQNGYVKRHEFMIFSEVEYENIKFIQSVQNCIKYIAEREKIFIILDNFQLAPLSAIKMLKEFIEEEDYKYFKLLVIYNERQQPAEYVTDAFNRVLKLAEQKNVAYEWSGLEQTMRDDFHSTFIPNRRMFPDYIRKINNLCQMLAVEDAEYYMQIIHTRIVQDKFKIDTSEQFKFYVMRAYNFIYVDSAKSALWMCERLLPLFTKGEDLEQEFTYNYLCALTHIAKVQSDLAVEYVDQCIAVAKQIGDETLQFHAAVLSHSLTFNGWKDAFAINYNKVVVDESFIAELRKHKFYNTLAYYLVTCSDNDKETVTEIVEGKRVPEYFNEGVAIGKKLGNQTFLLFSNTKSIVVYSDFGFYREVSRFYQEKLLISDEKMTKRRAHLFMGMGYNETISENFQQANHYINQAIGLLFPIKDAEGIAECLYNLAINGICCRDFHSAAQYIQTIFKMVHQLGFETIKICNVSKLQGLLALCYFRDHNSYSSYVYLMKIQMLISHVLNNHVDEEERLNWYEDLFLYYFVNGLIAKQNKAYDEALNYFEQAERYYLDCSGLQFYAAIEFTVEYCDLCKILEKVEKAEEIKKAGFAYCDANGFTNKKIQINNLLLNRYYESSFWKNSLQEISLEQMIDLAVSVGTVLKLEERRKDIHFLTSWQEMTNREEIEEEELMKSAMSMIQNNFNLDGIILFNCKHKRVYPIYQSEEFDLTERQQEDIYKFFDMYKKDFIISRTDRNFLEYKKILSIFGIDNIVTLIGIPMANEKGIYSIMLAFVKIHDNFRRNLVLLNEENLMIMKTSFIQLGSDLERLRNRKNLKRVNRSLNELVYTDMLTGLYNRQGLSKNMEKYLEEEVELTILYADLDNFKYYNDTFGHEIGDVVLVEFAQMLKRIAGTDGFAVRYGGDEFLIVLKNKDKEVAIRIAEQIYTDIQSGFVDVLSSHMGRQIEIPDEKKISCSIGIAMSQMGGNLSINETLKRADEALYYIKKHGKHRYILWEDVHEVS